MKCTLLAFAAIALFLAAAPLRAQSGCGDSPENPTALLALAGATGASLPYLRARFKARSKKND